MTAMKCQRCNRYWAMCTNHPDKFAVIHKFCPDCIPVVLPQMGLSPLRRPA